MMKKLLAAGAFLGLIAASPAYAIVASPANILQATVASAGAQTSAAGVMAGLGVASGTFTPRYDGVVNLTISGNVVFGTTGATGKLQIWYGTGNAPANNAAAVGAACGPTQAPVSLTGILTQGFSTNCIITGLNPGSPYWFDLLMSGGAGSSINVTNVSISAVEE